MTMRRGGGATERGVRRNECGRDQVEVVINTRLLRDMSLSILTKKNRRDSLSTMMFGGRTVRGRNDEGGSGGTTRALVNFP
jgi:hypothetical protein